MRVIPVDSVVEALGVTNRDVIAIVGAGKEVLGRAFARHRVVDGNPTDAEPFSAPLPHEPLIPRQTTLVVAGIDAAALGKVIADRCQRPLRVAAAAGCSPYERLTPERAAAALTNPERGWRKGVPSEARFTIVVTNATLDDPLVSDLLALCPHAPALQRGLTPSPQNGQVSPIKGSDPFGPKWSGFPHKGV